MSTEKEFDDLLRSKFEEQDFPFDESNWDQAEDMIDRKRKKEKRRRWIFIYFVGILTGVCVMLPFLFYTNKSESNHGCVTQLENEKTDSAQVVAKNDLDQDQNLIGEETENEVEREKITSETISQTNYSSDQVVSNQSENDKLSAGEKKNSTSQKDKSINSGVENDLDKNRTNQEKGVSQVKPDKTTVDLSFTNNTGDDKSKDTKIGQNGIETEKIASADSIVAIDESQNNQIGDQQVNEKDSLKKNTDLVDTTSVSETETNVVNAEKDSAISNATEEEKSDNPLEKYVPINAFSLFGGAAYSLGINYNDTISGRGLSPAIGALYEYHWKKKLALSAGLLYHFSGVMNYHLQESISHHPGFGLKDSIVSYSMKRLHYFNLPLHLIFYINEKNSIGLGGNFSFTGFSVSTIENQIRTNSGTTIQSETKGINYLNGYTRYDAMLSLSYRRKIGERWLWYTDFNYGFIDYVDNSVFSSANKFERNIFARTGLTFNILKP